MNDPSPCIGIRYRYVDTSLSVPSKPEFDELAELIDELAGRNDLLSCHSGNGAPYGSKGSLRPFAKNDTVW
jgi:hypothetical protein